MSEQVSKMKHVYEVTIDEKYSKKFYFDIMEYADKIELIVPPKESEPNIEWWQLLNWDTMEKTWWMMPEEKRQELRDNGVHPVYDSLPRKEIEPSEEEIKQAIIDSEILRQDYYELWGLLVNSYVYLPNHTKATSATFRWWGGLLSEIDNQDTNYMTYYMSSDINGNSARQKQLRKILEGLGWRIIKYKDDGFG